MDSVYFMPEALQRLLPAVCFRHVLCLLSFINPHATSTLPLLESPSAYLFSHNTLTNSAINKFSLSV